MIGPLLSAGASLIGGLMTSSAQKDANRQQAEMARQNIAMQKDFAQKGIQWKVQDARNAGIHPLYALGAQTHSFSPISVGTTPVTGVGAGIAAAGQDLSRAFAASASPSQRATAYEQAVQALSVERGQLENTLLKAQIAKLSSDQLPPPLPIPEATKHEERPQLYVGGEKIKTPSDTSTVEAWNKQLGEPGEWIGAPIVLWNMLKENLKGMSPMEILRAIDRRTAIW